MGQFLKYQLNEEKATYYVVWKDCFSNHRKKAFSAKRYGDLETAKLNAMTYARLTFLHRD